MGQIGAEMEHEKSRKCTVSMISDRGELRAAEEIMFAEGEMGAVATAEADAAECCSMALNEDKRGGEDEQMDIC